MCRIEVRVIYSNISLMHSTSNPCAGHDVIIFYQKGYALVALLVEFSRSQGFACFLPLRAEPRSFESNTSTQKHVAIIIIRSSI